MNKTAADAGLDDDLDPELAHKIEESLLFGKTADFKALLDSLANDDRVPESLRYGLEGLYHFRAHYDAEKQKFSEEARRHIIQYDADWTVRLIQKLHRRVFGPVEEMRA